MSNVKGVWTPTGPPHCPNCGQENTILGFNYFNADGGMMHTHYVCRYWASGKLGSEGLCGWHGWSVPGWDKEEDPDQQISSELQDLAGKALTWYYEEGQHNPEYGGSAVDAVADRVVGYIKERDQERQ